ncbi:MAG: S-layer homology domain-containing protein [Clostridiales bacterium]|nr:S-layer homology domain-containing protein [Clostridiales bacterium]
MSTTRKAIATILILSIILGVSNMSFAADKYTDVPSNHWASQVINKWSDDSYNVLLGDGNSAFAPSRGLSLGELAAILSKTFGYINRTPSQVTPEWADEHVEKAMAAGIIAASPSIDASAPVSRAQAIKIIALAYGISPVGGKTSFLDDSLIGDEFKPYVNAFQKLGLVVGKGNGRFDPTGAYTRAEALQVLDNTTSEITDISLSGKSFPKTLIIRKSGVAVKDTQVSGDLIIGQGVGDGEVSLENVSIKGQLFANGGGPGTISIKGGTIPSIVANKPYGEKIRLDGVLGSVTVTPGTRVIISGKVSDLTIHQNAEVTFVGAEIAEASIVGDNATLSIDSKSVITLLKVNASNASISGSGVLKTADVTASAVEGTEILTVPTKISVHQDAGPVRTRYNSVQPGSAETVSYATVGGNYYPAIGSSSLPTATPAATITVTPGASPSITPSATPSVAPDATPSVSPSVTPSVAPTATPSVTPSATPSAAPTASPSVTPSVAPTSTPSVAPTSTPSISPSAAPSISPSVTPSNTPSVAPTATPSNTPSVAPTATPSKTPSNTPSVAPTATPSNTPSNTPSVAPTATPSKTPSPSNTPTSVPTGETPIELSAGGLPFEIVEMLGLNGELEDNDSDGLRDDFEYLFLETDPASDDSDGNGVLDSDEDYDLDGLSNIQEQELGTRPDKTDTDSDGIPDGDEVNVYGSDPTSSDTDGDGLTDLEEVQLGLDPTKESTNGIVPDSERTFQQTLDSHAISEELSADGRPLFPSISGNVPGVISNHVQLLKSDIDSLDENRALLSSLIEVESDYDGELVISFNYAELEETYGGNVRDLGIFSFNENELALLETDYDLGEKEFSAEIDGAGLYMVLDLNEFLKSVGIDALGSLSESMAMVQAAAPQASLFRDNSGNVIDGQEPSDQSESLPGLSDSESVVGSSLASLAPEETLSSGSALELTPSPFPAPQILGDSAPSAAGKADIVFILDTTGSMSTPVSNIQTNIGAFANSLSQVYNIDANYALIEYKDITSEGVGSTKIYKNGLSNWYSSISAVQSKIGTLGMSGGGDLPETPVDALELARQLDWRTSASRYIILLTDAGFKADNSHGLLSVDEMAELLDDANITVSVIGNTAFESEYQVLCQATGGIFGNILANFSGLLLTLAEDIGESTNDGEWILLNDYQAVKLEAPLSSGFDTDGDSLTDLSELNSQSEASMSSLISELLSRHSVPVDLYTGKTTINLWSYYSNPVLPDTDFDGMEDNNSADLDKKSNKFSGKITDSYFTYNINFKVDYREFFKSDSVYNEDVSKFGMALSTLAYLDNTLKLTNGVSFTGTIASAFTRFGLKDVITYKLSDYFDDDDLSEIVMGHREVTYQNVSRDIVVIAVRGTDSTIEEWSSNFDVGADTASYWDRDNPYWTNKSNHKGFDVASNRLQEKIEQYISTLDPSITKTVFVTGHSRGAAIANILGANFEASGEYGRTFAYTFATPMNTTSVSPRKTVYNVVNSDDMVPFLPLSEWGFGKYGKTYEISVRDKYESILLFAPEGTWEHEFGVDYNFNGNKEDTLRKFGNIASNRNALYAFANKDNEVYTYSERYFTQSAANAAAASRAEKYGERISRHTNISVVQEGFLYKITVRQSPAACMMILSDVVGTKQHQKVGGADTIVSYSTRGAGENTFLFTSIGFYLASKYDAAMKSFAWSGADSASDIAAFLRIGGMVHTHMPGTYNFLTNDNLNLIP